MNSSNFEIQKSMEQTFHKNQLHKRLESEFKSEIDTIQSMSDPYGLNISFVIDLLIQIFLHKRANLSTLVGLLAHHFNDDLQLTADNLLMAAEANLLDYDDNDGRFIVLITLSEDIMDDIAKYQYPIPMVCEPRKLTNNRSTGYLVNTNESLILKNNHHDNDICLDHLDRANSIPLSLNMDTIDAMPNVWKNIDKKLLGESYADYKIRKDTYNKYMRTAEDIHNHIMISGDKFYLTHKYDKRGRVYVQGYHVNPQGNDWCKASILFSDKEVIQVD